ncbi:GNAT family N-acetyltransferase [Sorangium sp. So ce134]
MLSAIEVLRTAAEPPRSVAIYAVAVRQSSAVIPNIFALTIGANDRVFLHWQNHRPNNRLTPSGIYRSLQESDLSRPSFNCEREFINRVLWRDRWFEVKTNPQRRVFVCEVGGEITSFITFTLHIESQDLHVDELATAIGHTKGGNAGALLRYAETIARASGCTQMSLWSHETVVDRYQHWGFSLSEKIISCGIDGFYRLMTKGLGSSKDELARWQKATRMPGGVADGARAMPDNSASANDVTPQASLPSEMQAARLIGEVDSNGAAAISGPAERETR